MDKLIIFGPGKQQTSQLRNGMVSTFGIDLEFCRHTDIVNIRSLNRFGGTHTGRITLPADPVVLDAMADALHALAAELYR